LGIAWKRSSALTLGACKTANAGANRRAANYKDKKLADLRVRFSDLLGITLFAI
jgi:hypothetical protein